MEGYEPPLPRHTPQAFVVFGTRNRGTAPLSIELIRSNSKLDDWSVPAASNIEAEREAVLKRSVDSLLASGDFTAEFSSWVVGHVDSLIKSFGGEQA